MNGSAALPSDYHLRPVPKTSFPRSDGPSISKGICPLSPASPCILCRTGHGSPACHGHRCRCQARRDHGAVEATAALGASRGTTQHRRGGCGGRRGRRSRGQEGLRSRGGWLKRWQVRNDGREHAWPTGRPSAPSDARVCSGCFRKSDNTSLWDPP